MSVLVVDLARVLDESAVGKRGALALQARFDKAKSDHEKLKARGGGASTGRGQRKADDAAGEFEREAIREIEAERARLREEVLAQARPIIAALMEERKADVVVDAGACLALRGSVDVTDEVVRRLV